MTARSGTPTEGVIIWRRAYLLGAVTDVEQNQWFEPAFLERLLGASVKITLAAGEKKVQDLRLR